jgi:DNA-binding GntR family transcriptional regulator
VEHLEEVWAASAAELDPRTPTDYQVNRPNVMQGDDGRRLVTWPTTRVSYARLAGVGRDVVLIRGIEPNMRWKQFTHEILGVCHELGVELVVTLGALLADSPHTRPVPVTGTSSDEGLTRSLHLEPSRYEGPTGIVGVVQDACTRAGVPALSIWAAVPHYVAQPPCPKATLALLRHIEDLLDMPIPLGDLPEDARAWERGVDELAEEDPEVADYVRSLEEAKDLTDAPEASWRRDRAGVRAVPAAARGRTTAQLDTCPIPVCSGMTGTRAAALAQELRERIALADTGPGGALESEAVLGSRYGVSRVTVRRALEELRAQGLVESRRGAGWFVTAASFHQTSRWGPSGTPSRRCRRPASRPPAGWSTSASARPLQRSRPASGSTATVTRSTPRSVRSVDGVPLDVSHEWVPGALAASVSRADAEGAGIWADPAAPGPPDRRRAPVDDRRADHGRRCRAAGEPAGTPLLLVRRLALDPAGVPLALSDHRYLAHRFSLEVEFRGWSSAASAEPPGLRSTPDHVSTVTEERQTAP